MITIVNYNGCMDVRDLQIFLSVANHLNYTRAAREVNLSQPSVSVRMRQLERDLGSKLFEQLGKKIALTEAGQLLLPHATRIIVAMNDARHAIDELKGLERGLIRIGASTTPGMYLIPQMLAHFKRRYPRIEVQLAVQDTRQIGDGVIRNEFDFGFVGGHLAGDEVEVLPWATDQLLLMVPPNHVFAGKTSVTIADLRKERFIVRKPGSATRAAVASRLQNADLVLEVV